MCFHQETIRANLPKGGDAKLRGLRSFDYDSPVAELILAPCRAMSPFVQPKVAEWRFFVLSRRAATSPYIVSTIIANLPKGKDAKLRGLRSFDYDSPVAELF